MKISTILFKAIGSIVLSTTLLSACAPSGAIAPTPTPLPTSEPFNPFSTPEPFIPVEVSLNQVASTVKRNISPNVPSDDFKTLVNGNNHFAADLYQAVRSRDGNFMFSPYSISLTFAMAYAGARGETATQIAETLHFDLPPERFHPTFNALDVTLQSKETIEFDGTRYPEFTSLNSIWAEQTLPIEQDYVDLLGLHYGAGLYLEDFINQPETARKNINKWAYNASLGNVEELLAENSILPDTRIVFANSSRLKILWESPFTPSDNTDVPFYLLNEQEVTVQMMYQPFYRAHYYLSAGIQGVEIPYAGGSTITFIVPDRGNFENFENTFNAERLNEIFNHLEEFPINLSLPKFTFESSLNLSDTLTDMGMPDAFSHKADFSGIAPSQLIVKDVLHKTSISLDEDGTEAVAVTGIIMIEVEARHPREVSLVLDRPFIFVIRDANGQILFMGRVLNPLE